MPLELSSFSEPVRALLKHLDRRPFPLVQTGSSDERTGLEGQPARDLFPSARCPEEALSGLLLRLGLWEKSHQLSQDLGTVEGSYWHGIAHRLEPDYGNAAYWFRRVGQHPIFAPLHTAAGEILSRGRIRWRLKEQWDPFLFISWCEEANQANDTGRLAAALAIQNAEWELLFDWCGARI